MGISVLSNCQNITNTRESPNGIFRLSDAAGVKEALVDLCRCEVLVNKKTVPGQQLGQRRFGIGSAHGLSGSCCQLLLAQRLSSGLLFLNRVIKYQ